MLKRIMSTFYGGYERLLTQEVAVAPVPRHVAIIMDGNRRYAIRSGKVSRFGHAKGADTTEKVIDWSWEIGVDHLTIYAFSTENFNRSAYETETIFDLIGIKFDEMYKDDRTHKRRMKIRVIGDTAQLPESLQKTIIKIENATSDYEGFYLNVAIAYGGKQDIVQAVREIAGKVEQGELSLDDVTEDTISNHLYPSGGTAVPNVDFIIRTGGDERVSNFLPWQANGNECAAYFCAPFWPEFRKIDFLRSIRVYQARMADQQRSITRRTARFLSALGRTDINDIRNHQ